MAIGYWIPSGIHRPAALADVTKPSPSIKSVVPSVVASPFWLVCNLDVIGGRFWSRQRTPRNAWAAALRLIAKSGAYCRGESAGTSHMTDDFRPRNVVPDERAEVTLPCSNLDAAIAFYTTMGGFRLDMIMPADAPAVAVVSRDNLVLRLEASDWLEPARPAPGIRLHSPDQRPRQVGTDGVVVEFFSSHAGKTDIPQSDEWIISRAEDGTAWVQGRAGMFYRDLIPGRRQQSVIASHIRIAEAGPVADYVHYHKIGFQMIYCRRGWARLVYEDQGPPFILNAGDCVLQPPTIQHQVLEASEGFEVIELGSPARHETWRDHELELPTAEPELQRNYGGQRFVHHVEARAQWLPLANGQAAIRYTGISAATQGMASARVLRIGGSIEAKSDRFLFHFVLAGSCDLHISGIGNARLQVDDASLLPSFVNYELTAAEPCELLEVSLPANPHP